MARGFLKQGDGSLSWGGRVRPQQHVHRFGKSRSSRLWIASAHPQTMQEMDALMVGLTQKASFGFLDCDCQSHARSFSLSPFLWADRGYLHAGSLVGGPEQSPWQPFQPARLQAFWEGCVMTPPQDPSVALEGTAKATEVMEVLQNLPWESMPEEERSRLIPLLYQIGRQRGFPESRQGVWLDRMEGMIHELKSHPSQELFAVAYLLTGENVFLKQGREWLQKEGAPSQDQPLEVLIESIQRQWTWRWLPLKVSPVEDGVRVNGRCPRVSKPTASNHRPNPLGLYRRRPPALPFIRQRTESWKYDPKPRVKSKWSHSCLVS